MSQFSILQATFKRAQGDYAMSNVLELINFLDKQGFSPVESKGYKEQKYYAKTVERGTAYHGKARLNFVKKDNNSVGLALFISRDCQFPTVLYSGTVFANDVIPMVPVFYMKHLKNQVLDTNWDLVAANILNSFDFLARTVAVWSRIEVNSGTCLSVYSAVNESRPSDFSYVYARSASNKLELFKNLVSDFLYGTGIKNPQSLKTVRPIHDLRKHRNHVELFMNLLEKIECPY